MHSFGSRAECRMLACEPGHPGRAIPFMNDTDGFPLPVPVMRLLMALVRCCLLCPRIWGLQVLLKHGKSEGHFCVRRSKSVEDCIVLMVWASKTVHQYQFKKVRPWLCCAATLLRACCPTPTIETLCCWLASSGPKRWSLRWPALPCSFFRVLNRCLPVARRKTAVLPSTPVHGATRTQRSPHSTSAWSTILARVFLLRGLLLSPPAASPFQRG